MVFCEDQDIDYGWHYGGVGHFGLFGSNPY